MALLNETRISYCWSVSAVFFIFIARLLKPDTEGEKELPLLPSFCSFSINFSNLPPSSPPSLPLGYELNLTNDLFCLACLPLAMFSKWSKGNVSSVCAGRMTGMLGAGKQDLVSVYGVFFGGEAVDGWEALDLAAHGTVYQPELESRGFQGWMMMKALKRLFISS